MKPTCTCCGKPINKSTLVNLEFDQRVGHYHDFGVPDTDSQGWFEFGPSCAKKEREVARKALSEHGLATS